MTTTTRRIQHTALRGVPAVVAGFKRVNPVHGAGPVSRLASKPSAGAH